MNFSDALNMIKGGDRVARAGWNGKGMFVFLVKGRFDGIARGFAPGEAPAPDHPSTQDGISFGLFDYGDKGTGVRLPYIAMRTATGKIVPWAGSTDLLAEDWEVVA